MADSSGDDERLKRGRVILAHRLAESGAWWQRLGRAKLESQDPDGHTCIRKGRRLAAASAVVRSATYAHLIDADLLQAVARKPATHVAEMIADRFPFGRIPGYVER